MTASGAIFAPTATREKAAPPDARARQSRTWRTWREVRRRPVYAFAAVILVAMVALTVAGPVLPLPDAEVPSLRDRLLSPMERGGSGTLHLLGTDHLGRDVASRMIAGARVTIGIAASVAAIGAVVGSALGLISGYRGGVMDAIVMRIADLQMAFPALLLAILVLYVLGTGMYQLIGLLAVLSWVGFARYARAQTLSLRAQPFVEAAVAVGATQRRVLLRHVLPQLLPLLLMITVLDFGTVMLAEAGLSFLGMGTQPPAASWGSMVADGREFVSAGAWWLFITPGLAIFLTVFAANLTSRWAQELLGVTRRD
jgi:peptide/nickel transport system permease protein